MKNLYLRLSMLCLALFFSESASAQESAGFMNAGSEMAEPFMTIYPNPNTGSEARISLKGFKHSNLLVVVYDMLGREMYSKIAIEEKDGFLFSFDPALPPGVYLIIASANDVVYKQKLVVK